MKKLVVTQRMLDLAESEKGCGILQMDPYDFLRLTISTSVERWIEEETIVDLESYNDAARSGRIMIMPFLDVDMDSGKVQGHEGRHRAASLILAGGKVLDVAIYLRKNGHKFYYSQPYGDDYNHPKTYWKKYVSTSDVPKVFVGQRSSATYRPNLKTFKPFHPESEMSTLKQALARLTETADYAQSVNFVKQAALRVFGDVVIDPPSGVRITGGVPHVHVTPKSAPELKQTSYFAKLVRSANHLNPNVVSVSPDNDKGLSALRVEFNRA